MLVFDTIEQSMAMAPMSCRDRTAPQLNDTSPWRRAPTPPYSPHPGLGHTHHPSLGHSYVYYLQQAGQEHVFYVEVIEQPSRHAGSAQYAALLLLLDSVSRDALQALPTQTAEQQALAGHLGTEHIARQLEQCACLLLLRDARTHNARYYLRWDVYNDVVGMPCGLAVYRLQCEQVSFSCLNSLTAWLLEQQLLLQRRQPQHQLLLLDDLLQQVNSSLCVAAAAPAASAQPEPGTRHLVGRPVPGVLPWRGFQACNVVLLVDRTDNPRLVESRLKPASAQFPDWAVFGSRLPHAAAALRRFCAQHGRSDLHQQLQQHGLLCGDALSLPALRQALHAHLSRQQLSASAALRCHDFTLQTSNSSGSPLDAALLTAFLSRQQQQAGAALTWCDLLQALHGYLRCLLRSTVPPLVAKLLHGVSRTSYSDSATSADDEYIFLVRDASPGVQRNVNAQPSTVPLINDVYDLFAHNATDQPGSRNYMLHVLVLEPRLLSAAAI